MSHYKVRNRFGFCRKYDI